jgi:hypothetical protein
MINIVNGAFKPVRNWIVDNPWAVNCAATASSILFVNIMDRKQILLIDPYTNRRGVAITTLVNVIWFSALPFLTKEFIIKKFWQDESNEKQAVKDKEKIYQTAEYHLEKSYRELKSDRDKVKPGSERFGG